MYNSLIELLEETTEVELLDAREVSQLDMLEDGYSNEEIRVGE